MGFLQGKRALITGIASDRSIASGIAEAMHREGAQLAFTYQNDKLKSRVEKAAAEYGSDIVIPLDVASDEQIAACFTELGKKGASTSNISSGPGVSSVFSYMVDTGNETTFGHRRIILSNELGPIGLGSAGKDGSSCMQNIGATGKSAKAWQAWPPPGPVPMHAYVDAYQRSLDSTGWSIQSKNIDLAAAQVTVTSGGQARPVKVEQLTGNYGNNKAIRIVPDGWKAATRIIQTFAAL